MIDEVNEPLVKAFIAIGEIVTHTRGYPNPTHENVVHPNTHILLDRRDKFFHCWVTSRSHALFHALWKILIVKYEHCPNLRNMLDWFLAEHEQSNWKQFNPNRQMTTWKGGQ